jgi:hypothetical protein
MSRMPGPTRISIAAVLACIVSIVVAWAQDCPGQVWPPIDVFVYGQEGWWATGASGDSVQFVGDSHLSYAGDGGCESYDTRWANCLIDTGYTFRKITDFDEDFCSYTEGDTCYVCKVRCCAFWAGGASCLSCSCPCDPRSLCKSIWKVVQFYEDGTSGRGCYEQEFVTDCPSEDCEGGTDMCTTTRRWWD